MLTLYHSGGAGDFQIWAKAIPEENQEQLFFNASQLLIARGHHQAAGMLATMNFEFYDATNNFNDEFYVLQAFTPLSQYEFIRTAITSVETKKEFKEVFQQIAVTLSEIGPYVRFVVCELDQSQPPDNWRSDLNTTIAALGSNQALFTYKNSAKLVHAGLNFRSKTEAKIFDTLVKRGLLVMPLPVAVMGYPHHYKEPDFVVIFKGKVGILEIHGDKWHPPETAAQEHERRREFTKLGIEIYEIFGAERCWNNPDKVVEDFLQAFI